MGVHQSFKYKNFICCNDNYKFCVRALLSINLYDVSITDIIHALHKPTSENVYIWSCAALAVLMFNFIILTKLNPFVKS